MRFVHLADTHLGFSDYNKIDPEMGINLREADVYRAFAKIVDYIEDDPPDAVVHAGDLFDTSRPSNRAINFAMKQVQRISRLGIPLIMISGNHSTPRLRSSGSIFEVFEVFENVYPVYDPKGFSILLRDVAFHCVPHTPTAEDFKIAINSIDHKGDINVLVAHAGVSADRQYRMGEFNELMIPFGDLRQNGDFDYIALGHYHRYLRLQANAVYCGSTERFSFREAGYQKGFVDVDISADDARFVPIETREMVLPDPIDCSDKTIGEIADLIADIGRQDLDGKIILVSFEKMHRRQYVELDLKALSDLYKDAVFVKWQVVSWIDEKGHGAAQTAIGTLEAEFEAYMQTQDIADLDHLRLRQLGDHYLIAAGEPEEV